MAVRVENSGRMSARDAAAHSKDVRKGLQATLDRGRQEKIADAAARAKSQPAACRAELDQLAETTGAAVWAAKVRVQIARVQLKAAMVDRRGRLAQKRADCRTEGAHIRGELESARTEAAEYRRLERAKPPKIAAKTATRGEREVESLQAVEVNLPANLVPLWRRIGRKFLAGLKGDPRKQRTTATEAFLEHVAETGDGETAEAVRIAKPSRAEVEAQRQETCRRAYKEAQAALARGEADPRQMDWLRKFCANDTKKKTAEEVPF